MGRFDHWKADELRELASRFRDHAARTKLQKYIELLSHTAQDLEHEADVLEGERRGDEHPGRHIDFYI